MPGFSTHYIFAKELLPFVKKTADFNVNEDAVLIGTQGPDIFFFHRIMPWQFGKSLSKAGSMLHRAKPCNILEAMKSYCEKLSSPDIAKSYAYGFIMHYALDRKCHPFVYSLQDKMTGENHFLNPHTAHNIIEMSADCCMLNKRMNQEKPYLFKTYDTINDNDKILTEIGRLWEYVMPASIGVKITEKQGAQAVKDTKAVQKNLLDKYSLKKILVRPLELAVSPVTKNFRITSMLRPKDLEKAEKYVNIDRKKWLSPYSHKEFCDSFEDLFEQALEEAEIMLLRFQAGDSCADITDNLSFLTGVEVK